MIRDLQFAARMLAKSPAFTVIAILALALGIGLSTTMFTAVNALLLRPMPLLQNQNQLIYVSQYFQKQPESEAMSYPDYREFKKAETLDGLGAFTELTVIVSNDDKPVRYLGTQISADAFSFLGVQPILGRLFRRAAAATKDQTPPENAILSA